MAKYLFLTEEPFDFHLTLLSIGQVTNHATFTYITYHRHENFTVLHTA